MSCWSRPSSWIRATPVRGPSSATVYLDLRRQTTLPVAEGQRLADEAISRALELEPDLAAAHSALSVYLTDQLRYEEAEDEALRALELNPGSAEEHRRYARLLLQLDRHDESVTQARRAVELDPLSMQARADLGDAMWWAGDWQGTVTESLKLIEMAPTLRLRLLQPRVRLRHAGPELGGYRRRSGRRSSWIRPIHRTKSGWPGHGLGRESAIQRSRPWREFPWRDR